MRRSNDKRIQAFNRFSSEDKKIYLKPNLSFTFLRIGIKINVLKAYISSLSSNEYGLSEMSRVVLWPRDHYF